MTKRIGLWLGCAAALCLPVAALAYDDGDPCTDAGAFHTKNDAEGAQHLICNGSEWTFSVVFDKDGPVGIGDETPDSDLLLDVEGKIGAIHYCDENGGNCVAAANLGVVTAAGPDRALQFNTASALGGSSKFIFSSAGRVELTTGSSATIGMLIKGVASQSANLLEFQSAGSTTSLARVTKDGSFSNSQGFTNSEVFGDGATLTGQNSVVIGKGASGGGASNSGHSVIIGAGATGTVARAVVIGSGATGGDNAVVVGRIAAGSTSQSIAIGAGANGDLAIGYTATTLARGVAIGHTSSTTGVDAVALGDNATATRNSVAMGKSSVANAGGDRGSVAIGTSASNGTFYATAIGRGAVNTAHYQFVGGGSDAADSRRTDIYFGNGVVNTAPVATTYHSTGGSGTDVAGANLQLAGGKGTGNASGGSILFQTSNAGASGTTLQTVSTKMTLTAAGNLGIGDDTPDSDLLLDVEGKLGATHYCDENGANCFTASGIGSVTAAGPEGAIQFNNSSAFGGDSGFVYTGSGYVGIGENAPNATLHVNATSAGAKGGVFRGYTSQTANLMEWQNSSGTALAVFTSSGNLGVGTSTPVYPLEVMGGVANFNGIRTNDKDSIVINGMTYTGGTTNTVTIGTDTTAAHNSVTIGQGAVGASGSIVLGNSAAATAGGQFVLNHSITDIYLSGVSGSGTFSHTIRGRNSTNSNGGSVRIVPGIRTNGTQPGLVLLGHDGTSAIGFVGVGTNSPAGRLQVNASSADVIGQIIRGAASQDANLSEWQNSSGTILAAFSSAGSLAIGKSTPAVALDVEGDINYTGAVADVSDRRMKENIQPLTDQLAKITALAPVSFTMRGKDVTELGLIAQEVEPLFPDLVNTKPDGMKTLNYVGLIGPLVQAMKEQQREIDLLRAENSALSRRLDALETKQRLHPAE